MNDVLGGIGEDPIFSFSAGERNSRLKFTRLGNTRISDAVEDTGYGASSIEISAPVNISVGREGGGARARGKKDAIVKSTTEISKDPFGGQEVGGFGVLHVAGDLADGIVDVGAGVR